MSGWKRYLDEHFDQHLDELKEFLRIPSISALPAHAGDVRRAAQWTADRLERIGIEGVRIMETGGHPVVYGEWLKAPSRPTVLIYGHFDVQPVDPVDLWTTPPFEPSVRDGRIYARGANDDKGGMLTPIQAVEALLATEGGLPLNVKFFFEGQEEIGSPQLPAFVQANRDLLKADLVLSADGGQHSDGQPAVCIATRGICSLQIDIRGPQMDLHSGVFGGSLQNPAHALAELLASLRSRDGKILVEGFYDRVLPLGPEDRAMLAAVPFDEEAYQQELGIPGVHGEPGFTTEERRNARPTLEVNGIWGGFQGEGVKTVIPSEAHAKITCRLVADQRPEEIVELITAHIRRHAPPGVTVTVTPQGSRALPYLMPADHPGNRVAAEVLREVYGREPYYVRTGGSIPVTELFQTGLGVYTVMFAWGLPDERFHSPDEHFRLSSFELGRRAYCMLLARLAEALAP